MGLSGPLENPEALLIEFIRGKTSENCDYTKTLLIKTSYSTQSTLTLREARICLSSL